MDKRYRAKVILLKEGKRLPDWTWEYTHAASIGQASHNLMQRYPYPNFFVEEPMEDPERKGRNPPFEELPTKSILYPRTGEELKAAKDAHCANLTELRDTIKKELGLADEQAAAEMYHSWSTKFTELKEPQKANVLSLIAGQEMLHWLVLDSIVQDITKECGK